MAAAAETLKTKTEQFTAAGSQAFKDAVEKSLIALNEVNAQSKQNLEAVVASVTAATKGCETLGAHAIAYSKKTLQDNVAAAKSLSSARSVQEAIELQTAWAKSAMEAYLTEMNAASEIVATSVKETVTPLNARVTAAVEKFQAAR
ncbi:MAG TPA: TIGR01841 family phasin [Caulobacteraceae bacterium]|jgi:phasin family protein|nr:TIGR01841 family phasin [Caulobacteraceae bacterium]